MFAQKEAKNKKLWVILIIIVVLATVMVILEAQILVMLKDLQASIFGSFTDWIKDTNPLPPSGIDKLMDTNPLPPRGFIY